MMNTAARNRRSAARRESVAAQSLDRYRCRQRGSPWTGGTPTPVRTATRRFISRPAARGGAGPAQVTTCERFVEQQRRLMSVARWVQRSGDRPCHHVADAGEPERRLRFPPAGIITGITVHWFVFLEIAPVEVGREIGTALDLPRGIDVNGPNARATRLGQLAAGVARDLLQVVVGVGDHAAPKRRLKSPAARSTTSPSKLRRCSLVAQRASSRFPFFASV